MHTEDFCSLPSRGERFINTIFLLESDHDTDKEMEEWENQQIRKGVTGAQVCIVLHLFSIICKKKNIFTERSIIFGI